jgi:hypothetical protein
VALGRPVLGPSPGGDVLLAAARAEEGAAGVVGISGTARRARTGATGSQWKVTALGGLGGHPRRRGSTAGEVGSRQGLRRR